MQYSIISMADKEWSHKKHTVACLPAKEESTSSTVVSNRVYYEVIVWIEELSTEKCIKGTVKSNTKISTKKWYIKMILVYYSSKDWCLPVWLYTE